MYFWLVDDQSEDVKCGHRIEQAQLARFVSDAAGANANSEV
jgi:hypothetical protein